MRLTTRAATTRSRSLNGGMGTTLTTTRSMAATYEIRASHFPGQVRKAHGQCGSLIFRSRANIMQKTIYERPQVYPRPRRVLTGNLRSSEKLVIAGNAIRLTNTAKYAHLRHAMSGTSKTYGHQLDSFWASRAMAATAAQRNQIMRSAVASVWNLREDG